MIMRRPNKPPPPPPLPPLPSRSPTSSINSSLPRQTSGSVRGGSEYAESVSSVPFSTRSVPARMLSISPASSRYMSCRSESGCSINLHQSNPTCCQHPPITYYEPSCCSRQVCQHCSPIMSSYTSHCRTHSPCHSNHIHHSHHPSHDHSCNSPVVCSCYHSSYNSAYLRHINSPRNGLDHIDCASTNSPPVPKERVNRPCITMSPKPILRRRVNLSSSFSSRSHYNCEARHYKLHIEKHIQKIYKYLEEREKRYNDERQRQNLPPHLSPDNEKLKLFETLFAKEEWQYLRSLRTPISKDDFIEIKKLGSGYQGKVSLVQKKLGRPNEPEVFAMKKLDKSRVENRGNYAQITAERDILAEAKSEWIVKLFYSFQDDHHLYFILEYAPGGDLMNKLLNEHVFDQDLARFYAAELSLAVQFVHDMGYIHRDLKPDNILIDGRGHIKLTDFGLCTSHHWSHDPRYYRDDTCNSINTTGNDNGNSNINGHGKTNGNSLNFNEHLTITKALTKRELDHSKRARALSMVGSADYMAPEVIRQAYSPGEKSYDRSCDWWSVGVILYEMLLGFVPFIDLQRLPSRVLEIGMVDPRDNPKFRIPGATLQDRILNWRYYLEFHENRPGIPLISNEAQHLILGLLKEPAEERLCRNGINDLKEHPFFNKVDWDLIREEEAPENSKPKLKNIYDTSYFDNQAFTSDSENLGNLGASVPRINDFTYKHFQCIRD